MPYFRRQVRSCGTYSNPARAGQAKCWRNGYSPTADQICLIFISPGALCDLHGHFANTWDACHINEHSTDMTILPNLIQNGNKKLESTLVDYSQKRLAANRSFVGQFLDQEGIQDSQYGIYGMSVFLILTKNSYDYRVKDIRVQNIRKFIKWIDATSEYDLSNQETDANDRTDSDKSNTYELRCVIPKICHGIEACSLYTELAQQKTILSTHLDNAQNANGSFGFLTSDKNIDSKISLINTALVLRTYLVHLDNTERRLNCINYLKDNLNKLNNVFEQLYVLNAIQVAIIKDPTLANNGLLKIKQTIRDNLKKVFHEVALNPTSFSNPINIDFNDANRTRYYRLYSDLILIESLALAFPTNLYYLRGQIGERVLSKVWACLDKNSDKDTTQHRMSFGFYFSVSQILSTLVTKYDENIGLIGRLHAWLVRVKFFGINFSKEVFIVLCSLPLIALLILLNIILAYKTPPYTIPTYINTIVSFLLARIANIFGLYYDNRHKNKI